MPTSSTYPHVRPIVQYLSLNGDGTGETDMAIEVGSLGAATYDETGGAVEDQWTNTAHGLTVGAKVSFSDGGSAGGATGYLFDGTVYYVVNVPSANTFQLSATRGGPVIAGTGDSTGTWTLAREAEEFYISDDATTELTVSRLIVSVRDDAAMKGDTFGAIAGPLGNGVTLEYRKSDDTVITDLTPVAIVDNLGWGEYAYDVDVKAWDTTPTDRALLARWTFSKFSPDGLVLHDGAKLVCTINDDLSTLVKMTVVAEGYVAQATRPTI